MKSFSTLLHDSWTVLVQRFSMIAIGILLPSLLLSLAIAFIPEEGGRLEVLSEMELFGGLLFAVLIIIFGTFWMQAVLLKILTTPYQLSFQQMYVNALPYVFPMI